MEFSRGFSPSVTSSIIGLVGKRCCCLYNFTALRLNFTQLQWNPEVSGTRFYQVLLTVLSWQGKWSYWTAVVIVLDGCTTKITRWTGYFLNTRAWLCSCRSVWMPLQSVYVGLISRSFWSMNDSPVKDDKHREHGNLPKVWKEVIRPFKTLSLRLCLTSPLCVLHIISWAHTVIYMTFPAICHSRV